ncbi:AI-2E family transporter [Aliifodinibius sp. S!AR15-10]|uniref:AI-2E family transporter n=1 Tax=Aliifodinibius sp. S!AR15-10 TaxID=2950437 RepID=UPI00285E1D02|nr:AI-2E family transporter [Aliifodinibius sp. S!AR15-10]MDR8394023.1 AI-2E family transporter [Aliifodinibius sp. S!AR15-10]
MKTYPFWFKSTMILIGLSLLFLILSYGKFILMPLAFSALFSMLLVPVTKRLEAWKLGRAGSIVIAMVLVVVLFFGILSLFSWQFVQFAEDLPQVTERLRQFNADILTFVDQQLGIAPDQQTDYLQQALDNLIEQSGQYVTGMVNTTTNLFTTLGLMPIFIFFMLYYKEMYETFLNKIIERRSHSQVDAMVSKVQEVTQNYLVGLITVILILAVLNTIGLLIVGIDHAIFFGIFAAFLAIIPYIGIIIGSIPPLLYALFLTDSLLFPLGVVLVFVSVQFLEGNFITPRVIGSRVSINPFIAMIALIIGGQLWGVSGMILFVPLVGILRVVFEEIPALRPVGYLLGNQIVYKDEEATDQ